MSVAIVVISTICFLIVIGNLSTIICFVYKKRLRRNPSYWYITSLAVSDVLIGGVTIPLHLYSRNGFFGPVETTSSPMPPDLTCNALVASYASTVAPHIHHLMVMSLDRYFKLTSPLKYRKIMTIRKAILILAIIWAMGPVVDIFLLLPDHIFVGDCLNFRMRIFNYGYDHCWIATILVVHVPCFFLILCNLRVYNVAIKYKSAIENHLKHADNDNLEIGLRYHRGNVIVHHEAFEGTGQKVYISSSSDSKGTKVTTSAVKPVKTRKLKDWLSVSIRQKKIVLLISVIVGASIGCWVPTTAIHMMRWCSWPSVMEWMAGSTIELFHPWLGYFNSLLNPIILLLLNDDFRQTFRQIYGLT